MQRVGFKGLYNVLGVELNVVEFNIGCNVMLRNVIMNRTAVQSNSDGAMQSNVM